MSRTGVIIQARMGSSRLPGKVLLPLPPPHGSPVLQGIIQRLRTCTRLDAVVVASSDQASDQTLLASAHRWGTQTTAGSEQDVLARYHQAAHEHELDTIIRITADCPCVDPDLLDQLIQQHQQQHADYSSNTQTRSYPHGLDAEVFSRRLLEQAQQQAHTPYEREHVTPWMLHAKGIKRHNMHAPAALHAPDLRITLDTEDDYLMLCALWQALPDTQNFRTADILHTLQHSPWITAINRRSVQKSAPLTAAEEYRQAEALLRLQGWQQAADVLHHQAKTLTP